VTRSRPDSIERFPIGEGDASDVLPLDELKQRASAGLFIVGSRSVAILVLGLVGNVVLAHLLTPHDFGVVAIGLTLVVFGGLLSDGGVGGGLIRRIQPPAAEELQALTAFQLSVTSTLAVVIAAVAVPFGEIGRVTALMAMSIPLVALQLPGRILLERSLLYRPLAIVEVSQVLLYNAWAIGFAVAGFGVWALATATVARAVAATLIMARVSPVGLVRPRFSWTRIRPLLAFGIRFQAATATWLVRDQGLNAAVAAVANVSTLGLWSLARRVMDVPLLLFLSLSRVSFPAMSQFAAARKDAAPVIERSLGMATVGSGIILTGLAASAPGLIPGVFGDTWKDAADVLPASCLALAIGGSVSVATVGYLYSVGDASAVLRAEIVQAATWFGVTLPLLPLIGLRALGLGWLVSALVQAVILGHATLRWTRVDLVRPLVAPALIGIVSAALGWEVTTRGGADLVSGLGGGVCAVILFLAGLALFHRSLLQDTARFVMTSVRAAAARPV
jgi:O-antigen/teichoic acid export membrane protein